MRVLILGCGPAGLVAARAAIDSGHQAVIVSKTARASQQWGCQYLHAPVPGYEDVPSVRVSYRLNGTPEDYRRKVYGNLWQGKVSPEDFIGEHMAWDIRETYERMWNDLTFSGKVRINVQNVSDGKIPTIQQYKPDHIISTIPAPALCYKNHMFNSHSIWANGSTTVGDLTDNSIVCDGTPERDWYRISNVFGYRTAEWCWRPLETAPGTMGLPERIPAVCVLKPLSTDCDCHPSVMRAGRYGTWSKGYLVHQVYPAVTEALS